MTTLTTVVIWAVITAGNTVSAHNSLEACEAARDLYNSKPTITEQAKCQQRFRTLITKQ